MRQLPSPKHELSLSAATDVAAEVARWLAHLGAERRMSPQDARSLSSATSGNFSLSWPSIWAARRRSRELAALEPAGRARLHGGAARGRHRRPLADARACRRARSFARFLERNGKGKVGALAAVRAPKIAKTLPKPLAVAAGQARRRRRAARRRGRASRGFSRATPRCWRCSTARGLRISEALGLKRGDMPAPGRGDAITVTGKGNKQRMVPVLPQVREAHRRLRRALPLRSAGRTARCSSAPRAGRCRRASCSLPWSGCAARSACRDRDAACAAPFLRHPSAGARRRPARDPGTARPRLAVDDADLHRGRHRTAARSLSQRPSARLIVIASQSDI